MIASGRFYEKLKESAEEKQQRLQWQKEVDRFSDFKNSSWPIYYSHEHNSTVFKQFDIDEHTIDALFKSTRKIIRKAWRLRKHNDKKFGLKVANIFAIENAVNLYRDNLQRLFCFPAYSPLYSHPMVQCEAQYVYICKIIQALASVRITLLERMKDEEDFLICELNELVKGMATVSGVLPQYYQACEEQYFSAIKTYVAEISQNYRAQITLESSVKEIKRIKNLMLADFKKIRAKVFYLQDRAEFLSLEDYVTASEVNLSYICEARIKSLHDRDAKLIKDYQSHYQKFLDLEKKWQEIIEAPISIYSKVNILQGKLRDITKILALLDGITKVKPYLSQSIREQEPALSFFAQSLEAQQALLPARRREFDTIVNNYIKNNEPLFEVYDKQLGGANFFKIKKELQELLKAESISEEDLNEVFVRLKSTHPGWNLEALCLELKDALSGDAPIVDKILPEKVKPLSDEIEALRLYGETFMKSNKREEKAMGMIVVNLAKELHGKLKTFVADTKNSENKSARERFKKEFNQILYSKNNVIKLHRNRFMKIIGDIAKALLLTVSVIGLIAYKAYTGKNPLTLYYKHPTLREERVAAIHRRSLMLF